MYFNGFLILSADRENTGSSPYRGVASGIGWPLSKRTTNPSIESIHCYLEDVSVYTVRPDGTYPPATLPEIADASQYLCACQSEGIVRALLCKSPRSHPSQTTAQTEASLRHSAFVGYDYAYSSLTFSALYSDLHIPPSEALASYSRRLNEFGLFENEADLDGYVQTRWTFIQEAGEEAKKWHETILRVSPLEDSGDFEKFGLYEVDHQWLASYLKGDHPPLV